MLIPVANDNFFKKDPAPRYVCYQCANIVDSRNVWPPKTSAFCRCKKIEQSIRSKWDAGIMLRAEVFGETLALHELAFLSGVRHTVLCKRLKKGETPEQAAFSHPITQSYKGWQPRPFLVKKPMTLQT